MSNISSPSDRLADDLLLGAKSIGDFIGRSEDQVYYLARVGKWPIGRLGKDLIASKAKLTSHANKITSGS
jgi:hypothetical protein